MNDVSWEFGVRSSEGKGEDIVNRVFTPHSRLRTPNSFGFTLLEVLLALAILALIMTIIYSSFSTASQSVERAEAARDASDLARTLMVRLTSDIANGTCSGDSKIVVFYGKKEEAEVEGETRRFDSFYVTTLTNWRKPESKETDLWEVGYFFIEQPDTGKRVLMRWEKRELSADSPPLEGGVDFKITDRVEELRMRYLSGTTWLDDWGNKNQCRTPLAVEITLRLDDGSIYLTQADVGRQ